MRVLTWNINGVRTIPQYHPWNTFKTFNDILDNLNADIICFQEMKTSRSTITKPVAIPSSYHSFFSFPSRKTGYSGVAIYTRAESVAALKAEEGLTGFLQPKPPLTDAERVSNDVTYPPYLLEEHDPRDEGLELDLLTLDSEGRAVIVDFGLFVLINVYCPNDGVGTEERDKFKMDYHRLLELRVRGLIEKEGREVIVVGDINSCAAVIDHCEGTLMVSRGQAMGMQGDEGFYEREYRRWIRDWLLPEDGGVGCMVDIVRRFWPNRKGMYTCWNTKISARESNYGTRIDYILITKGLVPWIKAADIQQDVKGSDHCPVYIDLHDEIQNADGSITRLRDMLGMPLKDSNPADPPRLAAKFWDEYSGKQMQLDKFFGRKTMRSTTSTSTMASTENVVLTDIESTTASQVTARETPDVECLSRLSVMVADMPDNGDSHPPPLTPSASSPPALDLSIDSEKSTSALHSSVIPTIATTSGTTVSAGRPIKRKQTTLEKVVSKRQKGKKRDIEKGGVSELGGQTKLFSFFAKPVDGTSSKEKAKETSSPTKIFELDTDESDVLEVIGNEEDCQTEPLGSSQPSLDNGEQSKQAWSALLAPTPIPRCKVHNEPAKEYKVNKPGPNKGKRFFLCSRPVGPGYAGRPERLPDEVDPQYRCNFFKWSSDARKEVKRMNSLGL
ncbi:hypothetical protein AMATHDRAFT_151641 [Amanita thiersii Skay4041]|uniref:DNA-(apurinic or apyrimidinic site) endonuclease 2 n=1 Tax=Amanita thiersii Skay4041 TaxID=703135 RepID=A0A2A9NHC7_9AGAR|nr:hypothetical protein AMATHDRAFT_151641 [Amanita thiersii Skay4041]